MKREEAIEILSRVNHMNNVPKEIVEAHNMAIHSLEAWDEVIGHLETTVKELSETATEQDTKTFAKGITFSISMIKNHLKEVKE